MCFFLDHANSSALLLELGHKLVLRLDVPEEFFLGHPELQLRASFTRLRGELKIEREVYLKWKS